MNRKRLDPSHGGFSLVEVMVAVFILIVGLVAMAHLLMVATRSNALAGHVTSTTSLAKAQLESMRSMPFYVEDKGKLVPNPSFALGGSLDKDAPNYSRYFDGTGGPSAAAGAMFVVRWMIEGFNVTSGQPMGMVRITVRCLQAGEPNNMFRFIGDTTLVTYRVANLVPGP